jgi:general secretion pathway protein G
MKDLYATKKNLLKGFTLIELLVVIAIIGILASIVLSNLRATRIAAQTVQAASVQRQMLNAIELYYLDMGFYPPDVNRGWDPGFIQSLPWNPDAAAGSPPLPPYDVPGTDCSHCPAGWLAIVASNWNGPYFPEWERFTPWDGKYDYNYWSSTS